MEFQSLLNHKSNAERKGTDVQCLIEKSYAAFQDYCGLSLAQRKGIINNVKSKLIPLTSELANMEMMETGMGNVRDKIVKIAVAIDKTPGVEDLVTEVLTGDEGMTLYEYSAYGVACALQPSTNPCATLISNTIGMLAAGNAVINIPHPRCIESSAQTAKCIDNAIYEACGIRNLVASADAVSAEITNEIMNHPDICLVVATGSEPKVRSALSCGKKVIAAGAANPVVIVDETADLKKAAKDIVDGAAFDNGVLCISENNIVIVDSVAEAFVRELRNNGVYYVHDFDEMMKLTRAAVTDCMEANRLLEGKSARDILNAAGISAEGDLRLIVVDTVKSHPFALCEMRMPLIPMVRVKDFEKALETAMFIEQGYRHSAYIHSQSISRLNLAAGKLQTSIFVKNGSSLVGLGLQGEGNTSFTLANITGEGVTTARHFARRRRCTLTSGFSIR